MWDNACSRLWRLTSAFFIFLISDWENPRERPLKLEQQLGKCEKKSWNTSYRADVTSHWNMAVESKHWAVGNVHICGIHFTLYMISRLCCFLISQILEIAVNVLFRLSGKMQNVIGVQSHIQTWCTWTHLNRENVFRAQEVRLSEEHMDAAPLPLCANVSSEMESTNLTDFKHQQKFHRAPLIDWSTFSEILQTNSKPKMMSSNVLLIWSTAQRQSIQTHRRVKNTRKYAHLRSWDQKTGILKSFKLVSRCSPIHGLLPFMF